jgi:hypothetical protein
MGKRGHSLTVTHHTITPALQALRELCERRAEEISVLKNQLQQKDAAMELLHRSYGAQVGPCSQRALLPPH